MTKKVVTCDVCGAQCQEWGYSEYAESDSQLTVTVTFVNAVNETPRRADLCKSCSVMLLRRAAAHIYHTCEVEKQ